MLQAVVWPPVVQTIAYVMSVVTVDAASGRNTAGSHSAALGDGTRVSWWHRSTGTTNDALNTRVMPVPVALMTTHIELINTFIVSCVEFSMLAVD